MHPNIIELREVYETPSAFFLVTGLVEGMELFDAIVEKGTYSEKDAARVMRQVFEALLYLHQRNIVHRDLKPENLLTQESDKALGPKVLLADFGLATCVDQQTLLTVACGTPAYIAPEVLSGEGYGVSADNWAAGVIVYILLVGYQPFYDENPTKVSFSLCCLPATLLLHLSPRKTNKQYSGV
jgi:calcium/calmodulin-dependent protein kinase IV